MLIIAFFAILLSISPVCSAEIFSDTNTTRTANVCSVLPDPAYIPAPPITDRDFWGQKNCSVTIGRAEEIISKPVPAVTEDIYLDFSRTGNRELYTRSIVELRNNLKFLVAAECLENSGRFLGKIEEYILSYLSMRSWVASSHDKGLDVFEGREIYADLRATETAMGLATAYSLLGSRLSNEVKAGIKSEIRRRVIDPYLAASRGGNPSGGGFWWLVHKNNWNAVCNARVVYTALIMSDSKEERAEVLGHALESLETYYLNGFLEDGYCSEGIGYWEFGFGHYLFLGEVLDQYTGGGITVFEHPKVRTIASFAKNLEFYDNTYPAFADARIYDGISLYSRLALARNFNMPLSGEVVHDLSSFSLQQWLMNFVSTRSVLSGSGAVPSELRSWFHAGQVLVCRPEQVENRFFAAIKGGNNNEFHNHNDVGSYTIRIGDLMPNLDPGTEIYTSRTFSTNRYESNLLNSWGHPVPVVAGKLQGAGRKYAGVVLENTFSEHKDALCIDLSAAYDVSSLQTLHRDFEFLRDMNKVRVTDSVEFSQPETFETAIITYETFSIISPSQIIVSNEVHQVQITVSSDGGNVDVFSVEIEEKPDLSPGISHVQVPNKSAYSRPTRIGIRFTEPIKAGSIELTYETLLRRDSSTR